MCNVFTPNFTINSHQLIVTKFQYPNGGDVNYVAFIQAIDEEYTGQAMEQETPRYTEVNFAYTLFLHAIPYVLHNILWT